MTYQELRDNQGKLVARYDPASHKLEIKAKGVKSTFDLSVMRDATPAITNAVRLPDSQHRAR